MTSPKIARNHYCTDPEDRVIPWTCKVCERCWVFVASREGRKNGTCPFGGPFGAFAVQGTTPAASPSGSEASGDGFMAGGDDD
jgi:hypothetical protein